MNTRMHNLVGGAQDEARSPALILRKERRSIDRVVASLSISDRQLIDRVSCPHSLVTSSVASTAALCREAE